MPTIHPDFQYYLDFKNKELIDLYKDLRSYLFELNDSCNELLYHTHALTSVYTLSEKLSDGYCMIPIYTNHLNLGFHKGAILKDPHKLLKGTGKLIRHIPVQTQSDYRNKKVKALIQSAINLAQEDPSTINPKVCQIISKIKR